MSWTGLSFYQHAVNVDETPRVGEAPGDYVQRLADSKARAAQQHASTGEIIVAADTIVADGCDLLGKPFSPADAEGMLRRLRGRTHQVYTALAVLFPETGQDLADLCVSLVPMRSYSNAEIDTYVASGDPFDKAGAYAIQHPVFSPVTNLQDCYASVMGLPFCHLLRTLQKMELPSGMDPRHICLNKLGYDCPVSQQILARDV